MSHSATAEGVAAAAKNERAGDGEATASGHAPAVAATAAKSSSAAGAAESAPCTKDSAVTTYGGNGAGASVEDGKNNDAAAAR